MYLLWVLRGGLPDRRDYPWARIRAGFVQCEQPDLPEGADAGGRASTHGGERGVQQRGRRRRRAGVAGAGELKAFESLHRVERRSRGGRRLCIRTVVGLRSSARAVVGQWVIA